MSTEPSALALARLTLCELIAMELKCRRTNSWLQPKTDLIRMCLRDIARMRGDANRLAALAIQLPDEPILAADIVAALSDHGPAEIAAAESVHAAERVAFDAACEAELEAREANRRAELAALRTELARQHAEDEARRHHPTGTP